MAAPEANPDTLTLEDLDYLIRMVQAQIRHVEKEVSDKLFNSRQPNSEYWNSRRNQRTRLTAIHERLRNEINNRLESRSA